MSKIDVVLDTYYQLSQCLRLKETLALLELRTPPYSLVTFAPTGVLDPADATGAGLFLSFPGRGWMPERDYNFSTFSTHSIFAYFGATPKFLCIQLHADL